MSASRADDGEIQGVLFPIKAAGYWDHERNWRDEAFGFALPLRLVSITQQRQLVHDTMLPPYNVPPHKLVNVSCPVKMFPKHLFLCSNIQ